jgi:hypothetical protein
MGPWESAPTGVGVRHLSGRPRAEMAEPPGKGHAELAQLA